MRLWPTSLRYRLVILLAAPLFLIAAVLLTEAYFSTRKTAQELQDRTLLAVTLAVSEHILRADGDLLSDRLAEVLTDRLQDAVFYLVLGPDQAYVTGYEDAPPLPAGADLEGGIPLFYDAVYQGQDVRVAALREFVAEEDPSGWMVVRVWQTTGEREALLQETLLSAAGRLAVLLVVALTIAWLGLRWGLRPLLLLEGAVGRRSASDLRPILHAVPAEVRQLVGAMNRLFQRLQDSLHMRERFIANASHQLRTPLAALITQSEVALRTDDPHQMRLRVQTVLQSAKATSRMAEQLLTLAHIEAADSEGEAAQKVDLAELAREATGEAVPQASRQGVDLGYEAEQSPGPVSGNPVMLREALRNLIDNAVSYGGPGTTVTVRTHGKSGFAFLEVEDNGPGIEPSERELAVQRFHRLAGTNTEGCGLGLAIVQEVAERHNGRLQLLDAGTGRGLCARLILPLLPRTDGPAPATA